MSLQHVITHLMVIYAINHLLIILKGWMLSALTASSLAPPVSCSLSRPPSPLMPFQLLKKWTCCLRLNCRIRLLAKKWNSSCLRSFQEGGCWRSYPILRVTSSQAAGGAVSVLATESLLGGLSCFAQTYWIFCPKHPASPSRSESSAIFNNLVTIIQFE